MKNLIVFMLVALCFACGAGGGSSKVEIKAGGKNISLEVKSSGTSNSVKTFTDSAGKITTATAMSVFIANFDVDTTNAGTMRKPLTSADQVRLSVQLIGQEGTDQNSEFKPGIYKADPKEKFMKVDSLIVTTSADGKDVNTNFDTMFSGSKITGQVEVKSVTADAINGTIDITDGDKSVKGAFSARVAAKK